MVKDFTYLVVGKQKCWKCHNETKVIGFCLPKTVSLYNVPLTNWENGEFDKDADEYDYTKFFFEKEEFEIEENFSYEVLNLQNLSKKLLNFIHKKYNYKLKYSKTIGRKYYANCCEHCDALQGDYFLFDEIDFPFNVTSREMASKLKFIKFALKK